MKGFTTTIDAPTKRPLPLVPRCGECGLFRHCKSPKMGVAGQGRKKILVVGEAPGAQEDDQGEPFVGASGELVGEVMARAGIDFRVDCWIMNAAACRPENNKLPPKAVEHCRPLVVKAIEELKPRVVLLLGGSAIKSVVGWAWKEDVGAAGRWEGWQIPHQGTNSWLCPTVHPAYIFYAENSDMVRMFFERHVAAAVALHGSRPWKERPQWERQVKVLLDPDEAARRIVMLSVNHGQKQAAEYGKPLAFDLETTSLKSFSSNAEIYCCSLSDGVYSYAFPWHGAVVDAMRDFLVSDVPKIGFNCKFESVWLKAKLGVTVRNWIWDGMIATHVLDNRDSVCSLKFQAFVRLGMGAYDDEVALYLKAKGSHARNRIREAPLDKVLRYCAMDSLLEHRLWQLQQKEFDR